MSLVTYPDSDSDTELEQTAQTPSPLDDNHRKRKRSRDDEGEKSTARISSKSSPPPLPSQFSQLYASNVRSSTNDDPSMHGGRRRQVPHVAGNWPSFIYLEWLPADTELQLLDKIIEGTAKCAEPETDSITTPSEIHSSLRSELGVRLPLHVSLSSPLSLTTENKDTFEESVAQAIHAAQIDAFIVSPSSLRWVSNFDKSRYFLILALGWPTGNALNTLLSTCNDVARRFSLPELYTQDASKVGVSSNRNDLSCSQTASSTFHENSKFHVSIAWSLSPPSDMPSADESLFAEVSNLKIEFNNILLKIGNHVSELPLQKPPRKP